MPLFTDQLGNQLNLPVIPTRIISLVPSQTELLYDLGLDEEVIAITKFCIHPDTWFRNKTRIGGTKNLDLEKITELKPDLIIANKEENNYEQVKLLQQQFPVWISDVANIPGGLSMIQQIGAITGKTEKAQELTIEIEKKLGLLVQARSVKKTAVIYLIWKDPYMTIGGDTFIHSMIEAAGFDNLFAHSTRYPEITLDDIRQNNHAILLLSSEPYPFADKHISEFRSLGVNNPIHLVDGEMFSWYGSRMLKAPGYFLQLKSQIANSFVAGNK